MWFGLNLNKKIYLFPWLYAILFILFLFPVNRSLGGHIARINRYLENGTVMLNDESGKILIAVNPDKLYMPASLIKVLTAAAALDILGEDFRFKTEYRLTDNSDLIIKGYGDPFLVSDEIRLFAQDLKKNNITHINRLLFDRSFFAADLSIPGVSGTSRPYDALNGALVVNFNTIYIGKDASGEIYSAERETPLTPLARSRGASLVPGSKARINLSSDKKNCDQYAAELIYTIFLEEGIAIHDNKFGEAVMGNDEESYTYYNSRTLADVLKGLLEYSNNFIANQLFLYTGAEKKSPPADMGKGKEVFEDYIQNNLNFFENELTVAEGSGISRMNRISGRVMLSIMEEFKPYVQLLASRNGHPAKSGTLMNVSNYAGYIKTDKGLRSFVIILNQGICHRDPLMKILADYP